MRPIIVKRRLIRTTATDEANIRRIRIKRKLATDMDAIRRALAEEARRD